MTTRELRSEVSSFCCTDIAEKDLRFISYANLALRTIFNEICVTGERKIILGGKPLRYIDRVVHEGGKTTTITLVGNSYSMLLSGKGTVTVSDCGKATRKSFDTEETALRGFLSGDATLTLEGDESFEVLSLSCFKENFGSNPSEIKILGRLNTYSMRELVMDFHSFLSTPTDALGAIVSGVKLIDDKIIVGGEKTGEINVTYRRLPKRIQADYPDETIDIPESCSELLGILTSYFILLEDEKDRAEYFKSLYNDAVNVRENKLFERLSDVYSDVSGWA